jgi:Zn-dependent M32 family carboxypeptidase
MNDDKLVVCHTAGTEWQAQLIKEILENNGIPVLLGVDVSPFPAVGSSFGDVRITVRQRDLRRAQEIIADYFAA